MKIKLLPILACTLLLMLTTGLCGGFTTYSTFSMQAVRQKVMEKVFENLDLQFL